jgi:hypothetical protein
LFFFRFLLEESDEDEFNDLIFPKAEELIKTFVSLKISYSEACPELTDIIS